MSEAIETEHRRARRQLHSLTGLRILAALWVLFHHLGPDIERVAPGLNFLQPLIARGGTGVDLFFALSGFILAYNYIGRLGPRFDRRSYGRFLRLRIARVYPVHLVTLHLDILLVLAAATAGIRMESMTFDSPDWPLLYVENLLLVQAWFGQPYSFNGPAWSVSAEWFAYLLFPFLALLVFRVRATLLSALGAALPLLAYMALTGTVLSDQDAGRPDYALLRIAVSFLAGCFLFKLYEALPNAGRVWAWLTPLVVVALIVCCYVPAVPSQWLAVLTAVLVLGVAYGSDPGSRLLATPIFVFGGLISYALYMVHGNVLKVVRGLMLDRVPDGAWLPGLAVVLLATIASLFSAWLVYRFVEEPARRWLRPRPQPSAAAPAAALTQSADGGR